MGVLNSIINSDALTYEHETITIGVVMDTEDPQEMGRIRVQCPAWGDLDDKPISDIPFALYMSPFGGQVNTMKRGPEQNLTEGTLSYGMWAIPKVGSQVIVACIDGNPERRVWLGCVYGQFLTHTLPHGRYLPDGPLTSNETHVEPLYTNQRTAFGNSRESGTRALDLQAAAITSAALDRSLSEQADGDGQGYNVSQVDSRLGNESQVYSMTSPGFHAISMDDHIANCRVRIRTTKGHQVIFDDTNERIYINTAKGNNWIELDENGNIDVYSSKRVSVHAEQDINFTAGGAFRVHASGIHLYSSSEVRVHAAGDVSVKSNTNLRLHSVQDAHLESGNNFYVKCGGGVAMETTSHFNIKSSATLNLTSTDELNILATTKDVFIAAPGKVVHTQGAVSAAAASSRSSDAKEAFWTNRVPQHEGWARVMKVGTDGASDNTHTDEFSYDDERVGREEFGVELEPKRNSYWRR